MKRLALIVAVAAFSLAACQNTPENQAMLDAFKADAAEAQAYAEDLATQVDAAKAEVEALPESDAGRQPLLDRIAQLEEALDEALDVASQFNEQLADMQEPMDVAPVVIGSASDIAAREFPEYAGTIGLATTMLTTLGAGLGWWNQRRKTAGVVRSIDEARVDGGGDVLKLDPKKLKDAQDRRGVRETVRRIRKSS